MELKNRTMPKELQMFNSLAPRFELTNKDKLTHFNLQKGYEGELMFDQILHNQLQCEHLIIKDLLLDLDSNIFQIDTLVIFPSVIELFEVKNFEGEHFYDRDKDKLYRNIDYEIQNPEHQMSRAESLLRKLLKQHGFPVNLRGTVVFVNPEFTLYNHTPDKPIILPSQINPLMRKLNQNSTRKITNQQKTIGNKLVSLHEEDYPTKKVPEYTFRELRKGINCGHCSSFSVTIKGHYCYCGVCGQRELVKSVVIRSVQDYKLLFPKERVTKAIIFEWCGGMVSEQRVMRILTKHFQLVNKKRWAYYETSTTSS
ncbi:nuclease-related domain-containing protein [Paucisalibacillus globulus]|uniref:nuclease-related domain-containing protein n=1 Tax=Paucisalibacillus globulus TaxID=351095 RepID=UPI000BB7CB56|nr:nuclease-related domain-containing protein [Paucisalibacillus globulus]